MSQKFHFINIFTKQPLVWLDVGDIWPKRVLLLLFSPFPGEDCAINLLNISIALLPSWYHPNVVFEISNNPISLSIFLTDVLSTPCDQERPY